MMAASWRKEDFYSKWEKSVVTKLHTRCKHKSLRTLHCTFTTVYLTMNIFYLLPLQIRVGPVVNKPRPGFDGQSHGDGIGPNRPQGYGAGSGDNSGGYQNGASAAASYYGAGAGSQDASGQQHQQQEGEH
eukprot:m.105791 g.105791  ORF g.105791 m.105791 type:complete len:130 (-) comp15800_c1_seq16:1966-2355(-)